MSRSNSPSSILKIHEERFDAFRINRNFASGSSVEVLKTPIVGFVRAVYAMKTREITGEASEVYVDVGTTVDDPDEFIDNWNATAAGVNEPVVATGDAHATYSSAVPFGIKSFTSQSPIYVRFTDTNIGSLTAGEVILLFELVDLTSYRK